MSERARSEMTTMGEAADAASLVAKEFKGTPSEPLTASGNEQPESGRRRQPDLQRHHNKVMDRCSARQWQLQRWGKARIRRRGSSPRSAAPGGLRGKDRLSGSRHGVRSAAGAALLAVWVSVLSTVTGYAPTDD